MGIRKEGHLVTITIDATALRWRTFFVSDTGQFSGDKPQIIELAEGTYTFGTLGTPSFLFSVTAAGTVDYPPGPLDGFVEGRGTTTLVVKGLEIKIDARPLAMPSFWLLDSGSDLSLQRPADVENTLRLIPGGYRFGTLVNSAFLFDVTAAGTVDYPVTPTIPYPAGRGSATLQVNPTLAR
jgi:hypothetical protein